MTSDLYEEIGRSYNSLKTALEQSENDLSWKSRIYHGHTHTSVFAPALTDALIYLFGQSRRKEGQFPA